MKHFIKHTLRIFTLLILCQATVTVPMWNTAKQYGRRIFAGATTAAHYGISLGIPLTGNALWLTASLNEPKVINFLIEKKVIEPISPVEEEIYRPILRSKRIKASEIELYKTTQECSDFFDHVSYRANIPTFKPNACALFDKTIIYGRTMPSDQLEAVLEHENGHIEHNHFTKMAAVGIGIPIAVEAISRVAKKTFNTAFKIIPNPYSIMRNLIKIPTACAKYTLGIAAYTAYKRHCEWEADAYVRPEQREKLASYLSEYPPHHSMAEKIFAHHPSPELRAAELRSQKQNQQSPMQQQQAQPK